MKVTNKTTLAEITEAAAEQGYSVDKGVAGSIKRAAQRGALLWTASKIVTTDDSRLNLRPDSAQ